MPGELAVGHLLQWDVYDDESRLLLKKGQTIGSSSQITALIERGLFTERGAAKSEKNQPAPVVVPEQKSAISLVFEARHRLALLCAPTTAKDNFPAQLARICGLIQLAIRSNRDAALGTMLLCRDSKYSIRHSVDAAMIGYVVGTFIGMQEAELMSLTSAALTMNISMLDTQDEFQNREKPLSAEERVAIHRHPQQSVDLLRQLGVTDELWLNAVRDHHEAIDGSGYPAKKTADDLQIPTRIVSLSDIYCARVSGRNYRAPMRPNAALRAIFLGGSSVETTLAAQFIKALGVFPPGTPVRLTNGEIAVVVGAGEKANVPMVCSLIGPRGAPLTMPIKRDTRIALYEIREAVDWSELGGTVNLQAFWGKDGAIS